MRMLLPTLLVLSLCVGPRTTQAADFKLKDGDRVVLLGSTLIEREQRYGYWETALTARYPDRNITFRNLAWSGDTVWGDARIAFDLDKPGIGLKRMVELTLAEKPTVIFICYGTNESFEGKAGVEKFTKGLEALLDALAPAKARIVLMSPTPFDNKPPELPDASKHNEKLALYSQAIEKVAQHRSLPFIDLYGALRARCGNFLFLGRFIDGLTENGLHLTQAGYWQTAWELSLLLNRHDDNGWRELQWKMDGSIHVEGIAAKAVPGPNWALDVTESTLRPARPRGAIPGIFLFDSWDVQIEGLPWGKYTLMVDGQPKITKMSREWAAGVEMWDSFLYEQAEQLRKAIVEKNELYFHRWRPQNETYLFGFRKHEQGKNAKEVAAFDPLVAEKEKEIAKLRVPKTRRFEWVPAKD
jgi:lysophospholipase L1-like esterase